MNESNWGWMADAISILISVKGEKIHINKIDNMKCTYCKIPGDTV